MKTGMGLVKAVRDNRRFRRALTRDHPVAFEQIAVRGYGELRDLSAGGMRLRTQAEAELGAIDLSFRLPVARHPLLASGEVVWIAEQPSRAFELGIRFHPVRGPAPEVLQQFLRIFV